MDADANVGPRIGNAFSFGRKRKGGKKEKRTSQPVEQKFRRDAKVAKL